MWSLWLALPALAVPPPCGTQAALARAPAPARAPITWFAGGEKAERNPYGTPNVSLSENFAVRWGNGGGVTQTEVDRLLAAFEHAWDVQLDEMGHAHPYGTDAFRFNVYIGDSGDGAPPGYGSGGYYSPDREGWPFVVVSAATLNDPFYADHTASHEFYHAVQGATDRFPYDGAGAWFWESSAEWAAIETDPENPTNGPFVFAYALLPELPVNFFDYPDTGALQEYYQYGSFVFPLHLADVHGWELIRDTWTEPGPEDDPIEVMRARIAADGGDLDEDWLDHLGRNATWDYAGGENYLAYIDQLEPFYPEAERYTLKLSGAGLAEPERVKGEPAPRRYGSNVIRLRNPDEGQLLVRIHGDEEGGQGSPARFGARLVRVFADGATEVLPVPFEGVEGSLDLPGVGEEEEIWLMIGAWTEVWDPTRWVDEKFPYTLELSVGPEPEPPVDEPPVTEEPPGACACDTGAPGGAWAWLLALVFAYSPRRAASSASTR